MNRQFSIKNYAREEFSIRAYAKAELAMLYFPHSTTGVATSHLMRWINRIPELVGLLRKAHYEKTQKHFTSSQVRLIVEFIGEP